MIKRSKNKWIAHQIEHEGAVVNLVCFVFAGGSPSFFAPWKGLIPEWMNMIPVLYPMREKRIADPMPDGIEAFVQEFFRDNIQLTEKKIVIWGHCSGALIGMEYARLLEKNGIEPAGFIISGCEAPPQVLIRLKGDNEDRDLSELRDEDILGDLKKYQMMEPDMLANETFCKYFLQIFRADLALFRTYHPMKEPKLLCPATVMNGTEDKSLKWDAVEEWQDYFENEVVFRTYPGEHYFVNNQKEKIINDISEFISVREGQDLSSFKHHL